MKNEPKTQYEPDKRKKLDLLRSQLENERQSFIDHWKALGEWILPRRPRFMVNEANRGERKNQKIIDSTGTLAARTLRSGMMGGVTSPARPWFRLTTPDPELAEFGPVKEWLHTVTQRMATVFLRSNLYNALPVIYGDMGTFGTAAVMVEEDFEDVLRFYPFPIGSYMISNNSKLKVNVFFRDFRMTVRQLVEMFGTRKPNGEYDFSNFSQQVKDAWDDKRLEEWIDVCHVIMPNDEYDENKLSSKYKKYKSCYYENGYAGQGKEARSYLSDDDKRKYLRESGYDYFPVLCPRWETTGEDVYGTSCPGMDALGDIKALQLMHKRKAQAIEKSINPPMTGPTSLRSQKASILPGEVTYLDTREGVNGFRPVHEVDPRIQELLLDIQDHQNRIRRAYFEDLFLMLAQSDRRQVTAREIDEKHEEKLLALGPVLEQLNQDFLDPLIDITFMIMLRQGKIPTPPDDLQGVDLKVEYVSVMAQAQKLVGISSLERFAGFVGNIATTTGDVTTLDKVDLDQLIDEYGEATSVPPRVIRSDEKVQEIKAGRAEAQKQQQEAEAMQAGAKTAKDLSGADMEGNNALTNLLKLAKAGNPVPTQ